jgi:uncharacterized BrkB/YihY/UPF0761 family membrane protein
MTPTNRDSLLTVRIAESLHELLRDTAEHQSRSVSEVVRRLPVKELKMTALQGWIVIGLLVLIVLGIVGLGAEIKELPYVWRTDPPSADLER